MKIISNGKEISIVGAQGPQGPDGNPVGTVIAYMGKTAPEGYLTCDGAVYNISAYPALAALFRLQFGSANYFGGNGETTFAVPDLRNLFLRGYHGDAEEQLSGEIGEKQAATTHLRVEGYNNFLFMASSPGFDWRPENYDTAGDFSPKYVTQVQGTSNPSSPFSTYTGRPINMAVLYCIKAI